MPTTVQFRRGTTAQNDAFTGASGELSIDTDLLVLRVHDGSTAGGKAMLDASSSQVISNKTVGSHLLPSADSTYDLGDSAVKWRSLYLSGNTIYLGNIRLSASEGSLQILDSNGVAGATSFDLGQNSTSDLSEGTNLYYTTARADSDAKNAISVSGDLSYNAATGVISLDVEAQYTQANFESDLGAAIAGGTGITYDSSTDTISITNTGVSAGTYGSASLVPVFTVNAQGQLDSAGTVSVAGVSATAWDSATSTYTISTADGGSYGTVINRFDSVNVAGDITTNSSLIFGAHNNKILSSTTNNIKWTTGSTASTGTLSVSNSLNSSIGEITFASSGITVEGLTTGKITGDSASIGQVNFQTDWADSHIDFAEGAVWYDPYHKNLNYYADIDHPIEIGMQMVERVYNNTGSEIPKGAPLYYSGNYTNDAGQESPTVALADATSASAYNVQGLAGEPIANGSYGLIVVAGVIDGFDTSGLTAGQNFFAGLTPGAVQNAPPTYPNYPMCLGWVIKSDATDGKVIINQQNHSVNSFRVQGDTHIGADLRVDGDLTVVGSQIVTSTENVQIGGNIQYLNAGNTIGASGTTFVGSGLDDAIYTGHYSGDSGSKSFFVKIDATGTPDTFEWGFDSSVGTEATGIAITGEAQILDSAYGISIDFGATTGHTTGDKWTGTATAVDIDTGIFSNRHTGTDYTHIGLFFDVSENKWTFLNDYEPEPETTINLGAAGTVLGAVKAASFEGALTGNVTGNASTATILATGRNFSMSGDITAPNVSFNGSGAVDLVTTIANTGVSAGTYGSASLVPVFTVNAKGQIDSAGTVSVAGVSSTSFDSASGVFTINTADGGSYATPIEKISGGTGITYTASTGVLTSNDGQIVHDNLSGFVADEHIDHTSVTLTAGKGLSGGGTIAASRTFDIDSAELTSMFGATIFTDIKTRDGAGSGLDADTLDGQEGTYYRIDVYDASGTLLN